MRAEHKLQSISKLFIPQVIISQVFFSSFFLKAQVKFYPQFWDANQKNKHALQPIYIPRALNTGTCIQQSVLFQSAGLHRNRCQSQLTQEKLGRGFGKMQVNEYNILNTCSVFFDPERSTRILHPSATGLEINIFQVSWKMAPGNRHSVRLSAKGQLRVMFFRMLTSALPLMFFRMLTSALPLLICGANVQPITSE